MTKQVKKCKCEPKKTTKKTTARKKVAKKVTLWAKVKKFFGLG